MQQKMTKTRIPPFEGIYTVVIHLMTSYFRQYEVLNPNVSMLFDKPVSSLDVLKSYLFIKKNKKKLCI